MENFIICAEPFLGFSGTKNELFFEQKTKHNTTPEWGNQRIFSPHLLGYHVDEKFDDKQSNNQTQYFAHNHQR